MVFHTYSILRIINFCKAASLHTPCLSSIHLVPALIRQTEKRRQNQSQKLMEGQTEVNHVRPFPVGGAWRRKMNVNPVAVLLSQQLMESNKVRKVL